MQKKEGADAIAHGATGKRNDQVRFELTIKALAPNMKIIAPWREWDLKSRTDCMEYAAKHDIPVVATKSHPYSMDQNVWHLSHEGGDLENPANAPKDDVYLVTHTPEQAPDEAGYVTVTFKEGVPVAVDGQEGTPLQLLEKLNEIGAHYGVGVVDIVENRLVGMKSVAFMKTQVDLSSCMLTENLNTFASTEQHTTTKNSLLTNMLNSYMMACGLRH